MAGIWKHRTRGLRADLRCHAQYGEKRQPLEKSTLHPDFCEDSCRFKAAGNSAIADWDQQLALSHLSNNDEVKEWKWLL
jgi:hypothetical protein